MTFSFSCSTLRCWLRIGLCLLIATLPLSAQPATATEPRLLGPAVYGSTFVAAFHPGDPETFVTGTDVSGFYITRDGGKKWTVIRGDAAMAHAGPGSRGAWSAAFDPNHPDTLWLGGQLGLFKSTDGGHTASLSQPSMIGSIAVDPRDSRIVYAGNGAMKRLGKLPWSPGFLYKTTDGGQNWQHLNPGNLPAPKIKGRNWTHIAIDPNSPFIQGEGHQRLYAIDYDELWISEDAGATWASLASHAPGSEKQAKLLGDLVLAPGDNGETTLFATYRLLASNEGQTIIGGPYRSDDRGRTWTPIHDGLADDYPRLLDSQWVHSTIGWSPAAKKRLYWSTALNVYRSDDLGKTWRPLMKPSLDEDWLMGWSNDRLSPLWETGDKVTFPESREALRLWRNDSNFKKPFYGFVWAGNELAVSPVSADHLLCAGSAVRLTTDGGATWDEPMFEYGEAHKPNRFGKRPPMLYTHKVRSTGAQVIVANRIAFDPFDPKTLAIAYMDYGLFISRDNGNWWEWSWEGLKEPFSRLLTRNVIYDPAVAGRLYTVGGKYDGGGAYPHRSDDGGKTFTPLTLEPLLQQARELGVKAYCTDILLDPASPPDARTLYVTTTLGLYKSEDGGQQWRETSHGIHPALFGVGHTSEGYARLTLDPQNHQRLYFIHNGRIPARGSTAARGNNTPAFSGLYVTQNGGEEWKRLAADQIGPVASFSVAQSQPERLFAVAAAPGTGNTGVSTRADLWRSDDAGATWEKLATPSESLTGAYVHPKDANLVYLLTHTIKDPQKEPTALHRSRDGGKTWERVEMPGLVMGVTPFASNTIAFSPHDAERLYIISNCGVWEVRDPVPPGHAGSTNSLR